MAVIAGVTPITQAAFLGQQSNGDTAVGGGEDAASSSGSKKKKEVVHSLPWGISCGGPKGVAIEGAGGDSPMPSGDITMPMGEHLLQATRDKILRE